VNKILLQNFNASKIGRHDASSLQVKTEFCFSLLLQINFILQAYKRYGNIKNVWAGLAYGDHGCD